MIAQWVEGHEIKIIIFLYIMGMVHCAVLACLVLSSTGYTKMFSGLKDFLMFIVCMIFWFTFIPLMFLSLFKGWLKEKWRYYGK